VVGILVRPKRSGLIPAVGPLIARLEAEIEFRVSDQVKTEALLLAGEERAHP